MLVSLTVEEFSRILASNAPAPGGGSVAALSGALGADLLSMVCRLSVGREEFKAFDDVLRECLQDAESLSKSLLKRVDLDTEAFNEVMAAFKMPKETDAQKNTRRIAIQAGYMEAVQSPLGIAAESLQVLSQAERIIGKFNTNAMSDFGVAAQQAKAGIEGAVMNVMINLPSIKDEQFIGETREKIAHLLEEGNRISNKIYSYVRESLEN